MMLESDLISKSLRFIVLIFIPAKVDTRFIAQKIAILQFYIENKKSSLKKYKFDLLMIMVDGLLLRIRIRNT